MNEFPLTWTFAIFSLGSDVSRGTWHMHVCMQINTIAKHSTRALFILNSLPWMTRRIAYHHHQPKMMKRLLLLFNGIAAHPATELLMILDWVKGENADKSAVAAH